MIVVSDTSPVRALISIDKTDLLGKMFSTVYIPETVKAELLKIAFLKPELDKLITEYGFWVDDELYKMILAEAGESS